MTLAKSADSLRAFESESLTERLALLERAFEGSTRETATEACQSESIDGDLLSSAADIKRVAGQINVIIHAVGILTALPRILEREEVVTELSLGAGNTGRRFDLETTEQVAEFKFIAWRGGAESIRQNTLFKDFYNLAEFETDKRKCLYVLGTEHPLKFFNGRRSLKSVMSKDSALSESFKARFDDRFTVVRDYYSFRRASVELVDLLPILPELKE